MSSDHYPLIKKNCVHTIYHYLQYVNHLIMTVQSLCLYIDLHTQLQKMLLAKKTRDVQPDVEFLESFAGVVGSLWPSLAVSLCLSESEIEEVKQLPQQHQALRMLQMWVSREDATYGQLYQRLKTVSLFQYT